MFSPCKLLDVNFMLQGGCLLLWEQPYPTGPRVWERPGRSPALARQMGSLVGGPGDRVQPLPQGRRAA